MRRTWRYGFSDGEGRVPLSVDLRKRDRDRGAQDWVRSAMGASGLRGQSCHPSGTDQDAVFAERSVNVRCGRCDLRIRFLCLMFRSLDRVREVAVDREDGAARGAGSFDVGRHMVYAAARSMKFETGLARDPALWPASVKLRQHPIRVVNRIRRDIEPIRTTGAALSCANRPSACDTGQGDSRGRRGGGIGSSVENCQRTRASHLARRSVALMPRRHARSRSDAPPSVGAQLTR